MSLCTERSLKILALHILARRQGYVIKNILKAHVNGRYIRTPLIAI